MSYIKRLGTSPRRPRTSSSADFEGGRVVCGCGEPCVKVAGCFNVCFPSQEKTLEPRIQIEPCVAKTGSSGGVQREPPCTHHARAGQPARKRESEKASALGRQGVGPRIAPRGAKDARDSPSSHTLTHTHTYSLCARFIRRAGFRQIQSGAEERQRARERGTHTHTHTLSLSKLDHLNVRFALVHQAMTSKKMKDGKKTPVSHKVIEKRRRDRINRCLHELGKTVPMALAKQNCGKLEKAEILEMTVQYLRALHAADFPRGGREKGELLAEFASYFHYGYRECMKNLVHYLTTVERAETKDAKYARVLAFLQSRVLSEPVFGALASVSSPERAPHHHHHHHPEYQSEYQTSPGHFAWHGHPHALAYTPVPLSTGAQHEQQHQQQHHPHHPHQQHQQQQQQHHQHQQQHAGYFAPAQGLEHHYLNLIGHASALGLHATPHAAL
ncbi:hairy and enhancer of split-related protein helt [Salminus brasiliensis]|uniref:hairy and enhancer of split-related protein helt n=1 Tax=Salminus brasiliensis TaxID=930266 RepID=UPI003B833B8A